MGFNWRSVRNSFSFDSSLSSWWKVKSLVCCGGQLFVIIGTPIIIANTSSEW